MLPGASRIPVSLDSLSLPSPPLVIPIRISPTVALLPPLTSAVVSPTSYTH